MMRWNAFILFCSMFSRGVFGDFAKFVHSSDPPSLSHHRGYTPPHFDALLKLRDLIRDDYPFEKDRSLRWYQCEDANDRHWQLEYFDKAPIFASTSAYIRAVYSFEDDKIDKNKNDSVNESVNDTTTNSETQTQSYHVTFWN